MVIWFLQMGKFLLNGSLVIHALFKFYYKSLQSVATRIDFVVKIFAIDWGRLEMLYAVFKF